MSELIEPNPLLVEYYIKVHQLITELHPDLSDFKEACEWHYIESNIEFNILLLQRLSDLGLLPHSPINICDCGIGLGTIMYDLYLQSRVLDGHQFKFYGVEKFRPYIDSFEINLRSYWKGDLELISDDLMDHNFTGYNFLWIFTPYSTSDKLMSFFEKVICEIPVGGLIFGIDHYRIETYGSDSLKVEFRKLEAHKVDELWCFRKVL